MLRSTQRLFTIFTLGFLTALGSLAPREVNAQKPNIVIILADDMGFGDVGVLNSESKIPTPHLNRLASQGVSFLDAHSPSGVCTPTRYSLITGRYSWRTDMKSGVLGGYSKPLLKPDRATIATMLKRGGYKTGAVGKWHLGMAMPYKNGVDETSPWEGDPGIDFQGVISDSPIHHGFDSYFGVSASLDMAPYVYIRNDRFTMVPTLQQEAVKFPHFVRQGPRAEDFEIDLVLDRLVQESNAFIEQHSPGDDPYFLYVPFTAPHKPTQPKEQFRGKTGLGEYGDFIAQVDDAIGQILTAIDASGESENTLVIFTSDNGSYMNRFLDNSTRDHTDDDTIHGYRVNSHQPNFKWRGTKADIYEGGHRVPFFVRWPKKIAPGSVAKQTVCSVDCFATCAEAAGIEHAVDEGNDSFSILSLIENEDVSRPAPVIHQSISGMLAIRVGKWKLIAGNGSGGRQKPRGKNYEKPFQLFDMVNDETESNNVIQANSETADSLVELLNLIRDGEGSRSVLNEIQTHEIR